MEGKEGKQLHESGKYHFRSDTCVESRRSPPPLFRVRDVARRTWVVSRMQSKSRDKISAAGIHYNHSVNPPTHRTGTKMNFRVFVDTASLPDKI